MNDKFDYDAIVVGSGPAGQRAAIQAAKLGRQVAVIEQRDVVGGVCINTGTIPSKTLRESVLYLRGVRERGFYGSDYVVKQKISIGDLLVRCDQVIRHEVEVVRSQMLRNGVDLINGIASFVSPYEVEVRSGNHTQLVRAPITIVATGTVAAPPPPWEIPAGRLYTADDILGIDTIPRTLAVIGAGVIGLEYASIFAALGVRVTLIDSHPQVLTFADNEITEALEYHLRERDVTVRLGETVDHVFGGEDGRVRLFLASGKQVVADRTLYCVGRVGATGHLNLAAAGLEADQRGRLPADENFRTVVPHIYAAGDVVGFPSLASTSMEQGRLAACHAFGVPATSRPEFFPYGIYAIPEISMVGKTERELTVNGVPYETGKAHYREIAKGQILGDTTGMLKMLFHQQTRQLLGVHIIGDGATELIHIGQTALAFGATVDHFINTVFNYPTLAECYKVAAFDASNRMTALVQDW